MGTKLRHRFFKYIGGLGIVCFWGLAGRYYYVQKQIETAPLEISEFSKSGYTSEGVYGHGDLIGETAGQGWYIYDTPAPNGLVRKVCARNTLPDAS